MRILKSDRGPLVGADFRMNGAVIEIELNTNIKIYIADCFNQEGRTDDGRAIYEELLRDHPG
ncbi:MAG: hypothetical protein HC809_16350, partial [Gammaproteobacteria bacterium]|nr:hypothetical protein [Gammaproteobacteria bacterium]